jgi:hypothetical protein
LGSSLVVAFDATLEDPEGKEETRLLVARAGGRLPATATVVSDGTHRVAVWVYPDDPELPGLASLFALSRLTELVAHVGLGPPTEVIARSYRPGRRAVVEVISGESRVFVKAVRPTVVTALQDRHRRFGGRLRVPTSLGWSVEAGLVVMAPLPGRTLLDELADKTRPAPGGDEILDLLDLLPGFPSPILSPVSRVREHAELLRLLVPEEEGSINEVVRATSTLSPETPVPAHGDLHASQIMIDVDGTCGLLDIDSAGLGQRTDDLAGLLAHLSIAGHHDGFLSQLVGVFNRSVEPTALRLRTAAAHLGFASVPFVTQAPDWPDQVASAIQRAVRWTRADALHG